MSDDTVYRREAIEALRVAYWDYDIQSVKDDPCVVDAMTDWAIRQVKELPSAEPEIIRCKECERQDTDNVFRSMWCHEMRTFVKPNEFCSRAERGTDE